ncbi:MAG: hypothetical protein IPK83_03125 [Planctomycetes bacterium]|nr:hypothetical protein [Planctomycetota bacterium]
MASASAGAGPGGGSSFDRRESGLRPVMQDVLPWAEGRDGFQAGDAEMIKGMDKRCSLAAVLAGGLVAWSFTVTTGAGDARADDPPATQKAEDKKPEDPAKDKEKEQEKSDEAKMAALKAAAKASTQPAKPEPASKPQPAPGGLNPTLPMSADSKSPGPTVKPSRPPTRPLPTVPRANLNQPAKPDNGTPTAPGTNQPIRGNTPPAGKTGEPRGPRSRPNPRGNGPNNPGAPTVAAPGGAEQPASVAGAMPGAEGEGTEPVVTNTKTKMLVFQIENPQPESRTYRFQYYDMPWQDVLEDFSRVSGLPLVNKPDPPIAGNLTYFSNDEYTFDEAYHKINELLLMNPLNNYVLQRTAKYLTAERIPDLVRKIKPDYMFNSFDEFLAANLDPYEVCLTKFEVPANWSAFQVIEQCRSMFSDTYGTEIVGPKTLQLTGLVKEHMQFRDVVAQMCSAKPKTELDKPNLIYQLKSQKAATVQTILNQLYQIAPVAPRARPGMPATIDMDMQSEKQLIIVPDITNNILYIKGPEYLVADIEQTIKRIDGITEWKPPGQELHKLQNAAANSIVTTLRPIFQKMVMEINKSQLYIPEEVKSALDVDIYPDVNSNAIIIVGGVEGIARAKSLIEQYDVPTEWVTEIVPLQHLRADDAIQTIQMMLQRLVAGKGGATMMPQVTAQSSTSLLVSCSPGDLREVISLLEKIDVPDAEEPHEHMMQLQFAIPSEVAQTVTQVFAGTSGGSTPAPRVLQQVINRGKPSQPQQIRQVPQQIMASGPMGGGKSPLMIPNDDAKSLMVFCADKDWTRIEELVMKLDAQEGSVKPLLHTIELKKANPEDVAAMVNSMFPAAPGSGVPQIVTADIYNNTIQIFARPEFVEQVIPLIETLDINATAELTVIKLEHCKADVIAPILAQGIPGAQAITTGVANRPVPQQPGRPQPVRPGMPQQVTQRGDTSVRIVAEPITNSLLVTAPPKELEQIQKLVVKMEEVQRTQYGPINQVIVAVENRPADEIATTLTTLLGSGPVVQRTPGMPVQGNSGEVNPAAEELKVVANGDRIILKGPEVKIAEALLIIERIDVPNQAPIARKYAVNDAETDEQKLRTLLAGRAGAAGARPTNARPMPGRPGQGGQNIQQISIPTQATSDIQIYADMYSNTLLIRALPKEFVEIEEVLKVVLSDDSTVVTDKPPTPPGQFFMVRLKNKTAWDMTFVLEDLVNRDDRSKVEFLEGPTEKDLLVMDYKPGQEEMIKNYIEMFDVSDKPSIPGIDSIDLEGKISGAQVRMYLDALGGKTSEGVPIEFIKSGREGRVQVIDIHADEESNDAEKESGQRVVPKPASNDAGANSSPANKVPGSPTSNAGPLRIGPMGFPASALFTAASLMIAQTAPADQGNAPDKNNAGYKYVGEKEVNLPIGSMPDRVQILEDPETGQLMFFGPPAAVKELKELIEEWMDKESPTVVRVFPLKYADVNIAAQTLNQVFNQQAAPQPQPQPRGRGQQQNQGQPQIDPKTGQPIPQQPQQQAQPPSPQVGRRGGSSGGAVLKVVPE